MARAKEPLVKAELPELELMKRDLEREVVTRRIKDVEASSMAALPRYKNRKTFANQLIGAKMVSVFRQGEHILFSLDNEHILVVRMANGMLRRTATKEKEAKGTEDLDHLHTRRPTAVHRSVE